MMEFFKERLGEERVNQILQESVGKTYEEILNERDELADRVKELEDDCVVYNSKLYCEVSNIGKGE